MGISSLFNFSRGEKKVCFSSTIWFSSSFVYRDWASFFDLHGPLEIFNGFIIWYSRPLDNNVLTGLFSNPNYAGAWLNIVLPISFAFLIKKESSLKRIISLIFVILIIFCIVLTNSRSAWIGLLASTLLFFGKKSFKWIIPLFISIGILILTSILNDQFNLIPLETLNEFKNFQYLDRLDIWTKSIQIIFKNPLFGSGASSFNEIYQNISGLNKFHSHNLALDLLISYGIPCFFYYITDNNFNIFLHKQDFSNKNCFKIPYRKVLYNVVNDYIIN